MSRLENAFLKYLSFAAFSGSFFSISSISLQKGVDDGSDILERKPLFSVEPVEDVCDDLRIGKEGTFVAEHFDETAVSVVGGNFAVMYYCIVKERKGMSTAPPARGVCGITAVAGPCVALVFIKTVKLSNVLGESNSLENAHVLAAGENVSAVDIIVYSDNALCNELFFVQLGGSYFSGQRVNEVSPDKRLVGDCGVFLVGIRLRLMTSK